MSDGEKGSERGWGRGGLEEEGELEEEGRGTAINMASSCVIM